MMDIPSFLHHPLIITMKNMKVLTPSHVAVPITAAVPPTASADPAAPSDIINHPAPEVPKVDAEFTKARFGEYIRKSGEEEGKAKNSSI